MPVQEEETKICVVWPIRPLQKDLMPKVYGRELEKTEEGAVGCHPNKLGRIPARKGIGVVEGGGWTPRRPSGVVREQRVKEKDTCKRIRASYLRFNKREVSRALIIII